MKNKHLKFLKQLVETPSPTGFEEPASRPSSTARTEPMVSVDTSSANSAMRSRTTAATDCSHPVAEGVSSRLRRYLSCFFFMGNLRIGGVVCRFAL